MYISLFCFVFAKVSGMSTLIKDFALTFVCVCVQVHAANIPGANRPSRATEVRGDIRVRGPITGTALLL